MITTHKSGKNRPHLIVNSVSGCYSRRRIDRAVRSLSCAGVTPEIHEIDTLEETETCCTQIQKTEAAPYIIVAAGDGTINAALNGIGPGKATLALIPLGTSNVLARELGIRSLDDSINRIVRDATKPLAVGVLELGEARRYFSLMAGIGFDGAVVRDVGRFEKRLLKQGAYGLSALRQLWAWDREPLVVSCEGYNVSCHSVIISNAARYGGDFVLAPGQDVSRPGLSVVCITSDRRRTYLGLAMDLLLRRDWPGCAVNRFTANNLVVNGTKPIQVDGDFAGYGPARLSVVDNFARIIA
ncbi:MAG TPA: diacylglycerol kinase family protein [Desulfuromonadaceae bacterium]